jgi:regulation of enolase protein 1 (concanavalin A-like superfamily)
MKISVLAIAFAVASTTAAAQTLPAGFATAHIGRPALTGWSDFRSGTFTVSGAGIDIWNSSDQFTYVYRQMTGDGVIVARVSSLQHAHAWSKSGVMIRESVAADSKHAFVTLTGTNGVAFQRRGASGGSSLHDAGGSGTAPVWLRLERRGSTFTAARSSNGTTWSTIGSDSISMAATVYVGLAVTSHDDQAWATATFTDVAMPGYISGGPLPAGWTSSLIGAPGVAGAASHSSGVFEVQGLGADIWNTADQFMFVHRQLSGDGAVVAHVNALQPADDWSKAGVMVRESLAADARHAFGLVSGGRGVAFQRRRSTGGTSVHTDGGAGTAPVWLKVERRGSTFTMSRSADGLTWTVVDSDTISMASTVYVGLAVTSKTLAAPATASFANVTTGAIQASTLPAGWIATDVGAPGLPGSNTSSGGVFTVRGAGEDIWGTYDQFRFTYQQISGDVDVIARVTELEHTHDWAKAGVMIRSSLTAGAPHTSLFATPARGVAFQRRAWTDDESVHTYGGPGAAPVWLKLERRGGHVTAFQSSNGTSWTEAGTEWVTLPSTFFVGIAVTSHDASALTTATFDNVEIRQVGVSTNQPPLVSLLSPANGATFLAPASLTVSASASDADGSVVRVDFYQDSTPIGSSTASPFSIEWEMVPAGTYSLVAVARDDSGNSTVSSARTIDVHDASVPGRAVFVPSSDHATMVTNYVLEVFPAWADTLAANPVVTQDLGKPAVVNGECTADVSRTIGSLAPGTYVAVVTAVSAGGFARSAPSPAFTR